MLELEIFCTHLTNLQMGEISKPEKAACNSTASIVIGYRQADYTLRWKYWSAWLESAKT
jgi:hypothetical protein